MTGLDEMDLQIGKIRERMQLIEAERERLMTKFRSQLSVEHKANLKAWWAELLRLRFHVKELEEIRNDLVRMEDK